MKTFIKSMAYQKQITVPANVHAETNIPFTMPDGYKFLAVIPSSTFTANVSFCSAYQDGSNIRCVVKNNNGTAENPTITVVIIFLLK